MAKMFVTLKIMPDSPEINLNSLRDKIKGTVEKYEGELLDKDEIVPVAFGLNALKVIFYIDESKGSEEISEAVNKLKGISSCEVVDMRRAVG